MFEGFMCGVLASVLKIVAFFCLIRWAFDGFSWGWGLTLLVVIAASSWFRYLSTQTVRVRD